MFPKAKLVQFPYAELIRELDKPDSDKMLKMNVQVSNSKKVGVAGVVEILLLK